MQRNALQSLRDDSSIVISKPDKGNGVVIMNKSDYQAKMLHILDDKTKFSRVKSDNNLSNLSRFQRFLRRLKSKKLLEEDDYRRIYPSATSLPAMYGLPKIHKPTVPLRPILSATGSYNQECAKWLSQNLGFLREHPTNLKDSFTFVNNMKDKFLHNKVMVSFDVISLFTNIPVDYTIDLILDKLFDNDTDFVLKGIDKNNMRKLLKWTVQGGAFSFNGELFEQTDGVAMGGSLSCLMADVLMNHLVDKALSRTLSNHKPSIFYRYVDDCFAVFDSLDSIKIFCDSLNEVHPNIKFTTEIQNNKCINFLDVLVDNSSTTVTTSTFRKPTNTGLYSKWSSFVPRRYKYNLVNCLLDRAYKICSSYESICSEVDNIKVMLGRNGYPAYFLDSCVRRFFNRKYDKMLSHLEKRKNCRTVIARLPILGDMSMQLKKELSALVEKHTWNRVILRIIDNTWNIGHNFRLKDQQKTLMKYGVVYKLTCSCGSSYIGQTRRNLINRLKEHSSSDKSEVCRHLMDNPDHKVDFAKPNILSSSGDSARLLILESLFIQKYEPLLNVDSKSAPLYLFNC